MNEVYLKNIKSVSIKVTHNNGESESIELTQQMISLLQKSIIYQTTSNVIGFKTTDAIRNLVCSNFDPELKKIASENDLSKFHPNITKRYDNDWNDIGFEADIFGAKIYGSNSNEIYDILGVLRNISRNYYGK